MQDIANTKPDNKQIIATFPRAAYTIPEFSALFGREQTWGYRMVYAGKVKVIPATECRGGNMVPHSEVERLLSSATTYSDDIAGRAVPKHKQAKSRKQERRSNEK
jgi:hypothetical protein